jgi:hypothetical protein
MPAYFFDAARFSDGSRIEYLQIVLDPRSYVDFARNLLKENLTMFGRFLKTIPTYSSDEQRIASTVDEYRKVREGKGPALFHFNGGRKHAFVLVNGRVALASWSSDDTDHWHIFRAVQPRVYNDTIVQLARGWQGEINASGGKYLPWSKTGHEIQIERESASSPMKKNISSLDEALSVEEFQ